jgi:hypothetical protein
MKVQALTILSKVCLAAGYASMAGSVALWATGRIKRDTVLQNDGLFVGLWVPSFFILSNRFELEAEEELERREFLIHSDQAQDTIQGRDTKNRNLPASWRKEVEEGAESGPVQSPRPLQHTRARGQKA